jgi:RNase H-fold protein (predicted Holliday junction resolvase)
VDPGGRRIGFAVGDDATGVASPLEVVPYKGLEGTARMIAALEDGSRGPASRRTDRLAEALAALGIEVVLQNEFLSTNEARRRARAAGRSPRQPVDDIAAQVLLEEHLATRARAAER